MVVPAVLALDQVGHARGETELADDITVRFQHFRTVATR